MSRYHVTVEGREFDVRVDYRSEVYEISINGTNRKVVSHRLGQSRLLLLVDNQSIEVDVRSNGAVNERTVFMNGLEIPIRIEDYNLAQMRKTAGIDLNKVHEADLKSPMPGLVVDVRVQQGQTVGKGEPLLVIEAMKMENIIKAKTDVIVKSIVVSSGQSVEKGDLLLEFE